MSRQRRSSKIMPNVADHRPRAGDFQSETETPSRGSVHLLCSTFFSSPSLPQYLHVRSTLNLKTHGVDTHLHKAAVRLITPSQSASSHSLVSPCIDDPHDHSDRS